MKRRFEESEVAIHAFFISGRLVDLSKKNAEVKSLKIAKIEIATKRHGILSTIRAIGNMRT